MYLHLKIIASEESILLSHMEPLKSAIKSLLLVVEQFCIKHFFILFQFWIDSKHEPARPGPNRPGQDASDIFGHAFQKPISQFL